MTTITVTPGAKRRAIAAAVLAGLLLPTLAVATRAEEAIPANTFFKGQTATQYLAKDKLIGRSIVTPDGHVIGDIEDLIVGENNQIEGVIVGIGGFLGAGEKKVGVRLEALKIEVVDGRYVGRLPGITREALKAVPAYERAHPKPGFIERAVEKAKELSDKATDTSKEAYEKAKVQAGPALEKAKESAKEAYEKGKEAVSKASESLNKPSDAPADKK